MPAKASRFFALLFALALMLPPSAESQGIGGAIVGTVRDQSGAVVPAVLVRILNTDTGQARSVSTDNAGHYEAREIPPGPYEVTAELAGFNTEKKTGLRLSVGQIARQDVVLSVAPVGGERVVVTDAELALTESSTPTLSTSFSEKQIRELPILTRDLNNLALFAPGVFSVRTFSFASTLVPFAANGSRGRDNNFIIDSVDNNEPLFGGAATQFTNTDLFAEYRIFTNQFKAEYGRNSGSVVNIITERGGNNWRGSLFWFGQHDGPNALNQVEKVAQVSEPVRFYENQIGGTLGGPLQKEATWLFLSYQWDRARNDLSSVYPLAATIPTSAGLSALAPFASRTTVGALLGVPTVATLPGRTTPCSGVSGLPPNNPCSVGSVTIFTGTPVVATTIPFGAFLVPEAGVFDVRDHQASIRIDRRLTQRDDFYARYLFDDLRTPRTVGAAPAEVAFADLGLLPEWRAILRQRTQSLGLFWTHAWPTALHELRGSFTRISSQTGSFDVGKIARETQPAVTVLDSFANSTAPGGTPAGTASFLAAFAAAGEVLTLGRDTRPTQVTSNLYQLQDNVSISRGRHSLKFGANFVRTQSNIRQIPSDLGQYIYLTFSSFVNNLPQLAFQRFGNFQGQGGDVLPLRELAHFYFFQDDIRLSPKLVVNFGIRYEYYGQVINKIADLNPAFGPKINTDRNNFAPRFGFAWSPDTKTVLRGGYGVYYNPTVFNIALLTWQSGPISPFVVRAPVNIFPRPPFNPSNVTSADIAFTTRDTVNPGLVNPYVQSFSLSLQRELWKDFLVEAAYVGSKGTKLFQRHDLNPHQGWETAVSATCAAPPCLRPRRDPTQGGITEVNNFSFSTYHALHVSGTKRLSRRYGLALTGAYTWSHMLDNSSEIFGPGVRIIANPFAIGAGSATAVEAITPFPQNTDDHLQGERGHSSFDRRHRLAVSYLWAVPSPASGAARAILGNWQFSGFFTVQSGQPFTPINAFGRCADAFGDGVLTNDRPNIGNPSAPVSSVALLNNTLCLDPASPLAIANPVVPGAGPYITATGVGISASNARFVQAHRNQLGNAGRNILIGPRLVNLDFAVFKNFPFAERHNLQFRVEVYNLFNTRNPGNAIGNVFSTDAQPVPGIAFAPVAPTVTPARVIGVIPENMIDAVDPVSGNALFLSRQFMNTSARKFQFALKFLF